MGRWKSVALVVLVVLVLGFGIFRWRAGAKLNAAKERIHDAGFPVTYAELDEYYALPESGENRAYLLQFAIDSMVMPGRNMLDDLPVAGQAKLPHRSEPIQEEQVRAMRNYSLINLDAVDAVFESFEYEECRFPIDMNAGPAMLLPHLAQVRSLGRILSIRSLLAALKDDSESAAKMIVGMFELSDSLEKEPVLISQLVRVNSYSLGSSALEQAMNRTDFSAEELRTIQERLVEAERNKAFVNGLIGDRCFWAAVEAIGFGESGLMYGGGLDYQDLWFDLVLRPTGLLDLDGARYYEAYEQIIAAGRLPVEEQIGAGQVIRDEIERNSGLGSMAVIFLPGIAGALETDVRNRAHLRTIIVALAAARYELENGAYPDTAAALVPEYLDSVPLDPCRGDLIRYRALDHGFVAYSLGRDNIDNGGEESENQRGWKDGDLTFTVERP